MPSYSVRVLVLPHSGHCVSSPSGGCSTVAHSSVPVGASNPHSRHRCVVSTDMLNRSASVHLTLIRVGSGRGRHATTTHMRGKRDLSTTMTDAEELFEELQEELQDTGQTLGDLL